MPNFNETHGFTFKGTHSSKYGIYINVEASELSPARREGRIVIPGRSGYVDGVTGKIYDGRTETIMCLFKCPEGKTTHGIIREIALWLSGTGRLIYDAEPDKYYMATLTGAPPTKKLLDYGTFTISFACNPPFAMGQTVTRQISSGVNAIEYEGTAETPCTIILRNTSSTAAANVTITAVKRSG